MLRSPDGLGLMLEPWEFSEHDWRLSGTMFSYVFGVLVLVHTTGCSMDFLVMVLLL